MRQAIREILQSAPKIKGRNDLAELKRLLSKKYSLPLLTSSEIIKELKNSSLSKEESFLFSTLKPWLKKRSIRTLSGIAPVAVLTKPYPCPGNCAYCPNEKEVPRSYLSNEPAVMRAIRCGYNPYKQVYYRLKALENNGHHPEKIELIVIGGTWSYLPEKYKYWYIANCFKAANDYQRTSKTKSDSLSDKKEIENFSQLFSDPREKRAVEKMLREKEIKIGVKIEEIKKTLKQEQNKNEKAKYKIIGLTLETRPDYINEKEILEMRQLGATRVEIGVQAVDDEILKKNKRGHGTEEIKKATKLLKDYGFKVTYHLMPGLPGATPKKDLELFKALFKDDNYQPDQIKFYPTVVTKGSLLYKWYKEKKYQPYSDEELQNLIIECKKIVPRYVRIIRLIRDIPGESIVAGNLITNLRQIMSQRGVKCDCIRCREAKERPLSSKNLKQEIIIYNSQGGKEYFISYTDQNKKILYGFLRLRLKKDSSIAPAIIRELHVYGELTPIGVKGKVQHSGLGKKLMQIAENIAQKNKANKIAVISGIGVRAYYKKLGYKLKDTYLIKDLRK